MPYTCPNCGNSDDAQQETNAVEPATLPTFSVHCKRCLTWWAPNVQPTQDIVESLKTLVDLTSLAFVVNTLSRIAAERAIHIIENSLDTRTALSWDRDARKLSSCADKLTN